MARPRKMLVLAVEGCQSLDVLGPIEVFHHVSIEVPGAYQVTVVGPSDAETITTDSGQRLGVVPLPEPPPRHDTLLVAGGPGARAAIADQAIVDWVLRASRRARRTVSICTGAYLLAAAGLLDDRRALPIGPTAMTSLAGTRGSRSTRIQSSSTTARCGPQPASPPVSTSLWRWSRRTSVRKRR